MIIDTLLMENYLWTGSSILSTLPTKPQLHLKKMCETLWRDAIWLNMCLLYLWMQEKAQVLHF